MPSSSWTWSSMMAFNLASPTRGPCPGPSPPPPSAHQGPAPSVTRCCNLQGHRIVRPVPPTGLMPVDPWGSGRKKVFHDPSRKACRASLLMPYLKKEQATWVGSLNKPGGGHGETAVSWTRAGLMVTEETRESEGDHRGETCLPSCQGTQERTRRGFFGTWRSRLVANSISGFSRLPSLRPTDRLGRAGQYGTRASLTTHLYLILTAGPLPLYF